MVCPNCRKSLSKSSDGFLLCANCSSEFPVLEGHIPVLMTDPRSFLARNLFRYWKYIDSKNKEVQTLLEANSAIRNGDQLALIAEAIQTNNRLFESIQKTILSRISIEDIRAYVCANEKDSDHPYNFNLEYLRRDWCGLLEGEKEIRLIESYLYTFLESTMPNRVLFIGAGMARIPCDLFELFSDIYVLDNSVTMGCLFEKIRAGDIDFYEVNLRNAEDSNQLIGRRTATSGKISESIKRAIQYIIGDIRCLPFESSYFDTVISIYSTDVVPSTLLLREVKRVLTSGGRFIHFGPLEYHFSDISEMLSFEELKQKFEISHFEIIKEDRVSFVHCQSSMPSSSKIFTNWIFTARKRIPAAIHNNSTITVLVNLTRIQRTQKRANTEEVPSSIEWRNGELMTASDSVVDILTSIRTECTFEMLLSRLERDLNYESTNETSRAILIEIIRDLEREGVISIANRQ